MTKLLNMSFLLQKNHNYVCVVADDTDVLILADVTLKISYD